MAKRTRKKDIRGGIAVKAWKMAIKGYDYGTISKEIGFTSTSVNLYLKARFKKEASEIWSEIIRSVGVCEVCGKTCIKLNAHHILEKSKWTHLRFDLNNGVCLCEDHHTMNPILSPHNNVVSSDNFLTWMRKNKNKKYQYYLDHKDDQLFQEIDYETEYYRLKDVMNER